MDSRRADLASYSKGFKSGGYDLRATSALGSSVPYQPQLTIAYEPGVKSTFLEYGESVLRFAKISAGASAEGILNTHIFADGTYDRILQRAPRSGDAPNPFFTGAEFTRRYYGILHECLQAALLRPEGINVWSKP